MPTRRHQIAQGVHGVGSAEYTPEQYDFVVKIFKSMPCPVTVAQLHQATGEKGLTVRQIISAADGVDILLGGSGAHGYERATTREEADRLTRRFQSQATKMWNRISRRESAAESF